MIVLKRLIKETNGPEKLSAVQLQLIRHVVDGKERIEIGNLLGFSGRSRVDALLKSAMHQIGVKDIRELVLWAIKHKIVEDPPIHTDIHKQLTDQQAVILLSVLKGIVESELSKKLNSALPTVKRNIEELIKKFKIQPPRKTQLIRFAVRAGWSPDTTFEQMMAERKKKFRSPLTGLDLKDSNIVSHILYGHSFPEIEQKVNLSKDTIQHRFDIFRKQNGIKNFVDLVRWGRDHNILTDRHIYVTLSKVINLDQYKVWLFTMKGMTAEQVAERLNISINNVNKQKHRILKKFNAEPPNSMRLIRLGFQIGLDKIAKESGNQLPDSIGNVTPSTFPIVPSKFTPFEPDPDKAVTFQKKKDKLTTALYTLGIDQSLIWGKPLLKRSPEELWNLLGLAKTRYEYETLHGHPDKFINPEQKKKAEQRLAQVNYSWNLVKKLFDRIGYTID